MSTARLRIDWRSLPAAPAPGTPLCRLQELEDGEIREFVFGLGDSNSTGFRLLVLRHGEAVHGYVNQCPHHWLRLNRKDGRFLRWSNTEIMCMHHSAVFDLARDGHCSMGPCLGANLVQVLLQIEEGQVCTGRG